MPRLTPPPDGLTGLFSVLERHWADDFDLCFMHVKGTDSAGEDGDLARKVGVIEAVDAELPRLLRLSPEVLVITGDHSTAGQLCRAVCAHDHNWHQPCCMQRAADSGHPTARAKAHR
jgi:2,3-bisphosphoglycerate-independent phosphoglycerate mutase